LKIVKEEVSLVFSTFLKTQKLKVRVESLDKKERKITIREKK
jgi:hypothetical protein